MNADQDKILTRIGALLAKAESTDSEHERDALIAKAQHLATVNAVALETARQARRSSGGGRSGGGPEQRSVLLFPQTDTSRTKSYFIRLWAAIGQANDLMVNALSNSTGVIAFGYREDIDVTEMMYASLSVQMLAAAERYVRSGQHRDFVVVSTGKPLSGQAARRNFYDGFIRGVVDRLHEGREEGLAEAAQHAAGTDLVLREKITDVTAFYEENNTARGRYRAGQSSVYAADIADAGWAAGFRSDVGDKALDA